tara:strand:- start:480 stop:1253 length:774 start_codon:yes stop_codon:yes gene_type:complete
MIDYKIAIPSYKRHNTIKEKTLRLLDEYNIDKNKITVFVANTDEEILYKESLDNEYKIVVGVPTIGKQRNFIEKHYDEGTHLMMFDDDIDSVMRKVNDKLEPVNNLDTDVIQLGFNECIKNNNNVFGIYAASNPYFMENRIYKKLCYIIASMFGVIVQHDKYLERKTNHGEDYEYSIRQYIKNGSVTRIDYMTVKSNYYKEPGGLQEIRTKKYVYDSIKWIQDNFPDYCTMYIRKTTGNAELRLKDKKPNKEQTELF